MPVKSDLTGLVEQISTMVDLPVVARIYIPEPRPHENEHTEFGVVVLADNSAGLYYAWLGDSQKGMNRRYQAEDYLGRSPLLLAQLFNSNDEADCSLGLAAINAITQSVFRRVNIVPQTAANSLGCLAIEEGDHVGMVGYFPSLVRKLEQQDVHLTIIEKKAHFLEMQGFFQVSDDPGQLAQCNKVLCTASTLLNNSIDEVLDCCNNAEKIAVIGPTASFFPDPLFQRNVDVVGGTLINDADLAIINLHKGAGLAESGSKYVLEKEKYRGILEVLGNTG